MSVPSSNTTVTKESPKNVWPRAYRTAGAAESTETIGYVIWSSTSVGARPGHSVYTMTWTSERSGMASRLILLIAINPASVSPSIPTVVRNRLHAHHAITPLITTKSPQPPPETDFRCREGSFRRPLLSCRLSDRPARRSFARPGFPEGHAWGQKGRHPAQ